MADDTTPQEPTPRTGSGPPLEPQTANEARWFLEGVHAGVTRYAAANGDCTLRSGNDLLRQLLDEACDEAIGYFRKFGDDSTDVAGGTEAEAHLAEIKRMAEGRHLLHSSPGREDGFWGCTKGPCRRAAAYLRGLTENTNDG